MCVGFVLMENFRGNGGGFMIDLQLSFFFNSHCLKVLLYKNKYDTIFQKKENDNSSYLKEESMTVRELYKLAKRD